MIEARTTFQPQGIYLKTEHITELPKQTLELVPQVAELQKCISSREVFYLEELQTSEALAVLKTKLRNTRMVGNIRAVLWCPNDTQKEQIIEILREYVTAISIGQASYIIVIKSISISRKKGRAVLIANVYQINMTEYAPNMN